MRLLMIELSVASLQSDASVVNLARANQKFHEAFKIHTTGLMQQAPGIAQFETRLTSSIVACLASVDQLNSLIDVKIGLGQLPAWKEMIAALQKVWESADSVLMQTALTEEKLEKSGDA